MQKNVSFEMEDAIEVPDWADAYPEHKFTVFKACFLSTKPNSHELNISAEVLRECASTILGNFLVAKIEGIDATTHKADEIIYGYAPMEQEIEFVEDDDVLKAYCYFVVSKRYSKEFNGIFEFTNLRNSSVEMTVANPDDDEHTVLSFDIYGLTALGRFVNGSCPDADIKMVRFSQKKAEAYFKKNNASNTLKQFVQERKEQMAEKTYKVDKSKEAMSTADWGSYDKAAMRDKIMEAENRSTLVKAVYMLVEDGWEDAPSEHLKYPVMMLEGDTFVYNREALSSALAYAKQHEEQTVIDKVEKIYKALDLDDSEGKEDKKMAEIEFAAVEIDDLWCKLYGAIRDRDQWDYCISCIYEENGQKFAILKDRAGVNFRLDFSLTVDGVIIADEVTKVEIEIVETDDVRKFAEVEDAELMAKYTQFEEAKDEDDDGAKEDDEHDDGETNKKEAEMSVEELSAKIEQMSADIEARDNIIMENEAELTELRAFKASIEAKEKAMAVETVMEEVKSCLSDEQFAEFRKEGLDAVEFDAWANKVRAACFSALKKAPKKAESVFSFSAPIETPKAEPKDVWERLKIKNY